MKFFFIVILFPLPLMAQFSFTPFAGLNSTKMSESYSGYAKGGNYGIIGVEIEKQFKLKPYSPFSFSLISGVSYLANGFERTSSFTLSFGSGTYSYEVTNLQMRYWQVPLIARINFRPFALVEDWRLFFGAGISFNQLSYAHLAEQVSEVKISSSSFLSYPGLYPPPPLNFYQDSRDVTSFGVKNPLFQRIEFGMKFKHVQVTWRISVSLQDMYFKGIEKNWQVPATNSFYIGAHNSRGITNEKYSEIVFGWRFY